MGIPEFLPHGDQALDHQGRIKAHPGKAGRGPQNPATWLPPCPPASLGSGAQTRASLPGGGPTLTDRTCPRDDVTAFWPGDQLCQE